MAELSKAIARLMEERGRTQPQRPALVDTPPLRELLEIVRAKVAPGERLLADAFVRQLLDKAGTDLLVDGPEAAAALALATFRFTVERVAEEPRVLVFDPDLIHEGWHTPCTVIETLMRDRPFIVDTVRECLHEAECSVQRFLHPIFAVERDPRGTVLSFGDVGHRESLVHVEVERVADPEALAARLTERLTDVVLATDDYASMRAKAAELAQELRGRSLQPPWNADLDEVAAFLDWLGQKSFVFLGYREYQFSGQGAERAAAVRRGSGLGILRREERSSMATPRVLPEELRRRLNEPPLLVVSKTNAHSPIHRDANMDYLGLKEIDAAGVVVGERRFLGLFTSRAYGEDAAAIPLLRRKLAAIREAEQAEEGTHDFKAITRVFTSTPKVTLLSSSVPELHAEITAILAAEGGTDVRVLRRPDALGRGLFVTVVLPRERFSDDLYRRAASRLLQVLSGTAVLDEHVAMDDDSDQVRMYFYVAAPAAAAQAVTRDELRAHVAALLRTWDDRLGDELRAVFAREPARLLAQRYREAFSSAYKAATDVGQAVRDIACLERLVATRAPQVELTNDGVGDSRCTALKLYLAAEELVLSDFLPVLENLGLKVFAEDALDVSLPDVGGVRVHTFAVQGAAGGRLDVERVRPRLQTAVLALHTERVESDRLNTLVLSADLEWRQIDLLRTYVNHGVQIGTAPSRGALINALVSYPATARLLWEYFGAKFDPRRSAPTDERLQRILPEVEQRFVASLEAVQSGVDDRILRAMLSVMAATVRTNFFAAMPEGTGPATGPVPEHDALAIKLESGRIPHLPRPRPAHEIYVHAPHVEGIHLRGAAVARGGIRLSDRPDDFRTEVLDLMKTQMVKNAVIVPAGAKGGFIAKRRGAVLTPAQVVTAYRTFIAALLELTDNIIQGRVAPRSEMLLYDEADPYLVVAADKGTATFSDIANEVAAQRHFWLGDAFASGGTHGYDHKQEGITARGAWECVRRHFAEMGRDAEREPLTVVGIGDMSGDVFGNGLLRSRRFVLRAAFNHQHIFLDPNPDPARAYAERERLFRLARSSWTDYTAALISLGGGVYLRSAKTVPLEEAARQMLGFEPLDQVSGEEVVRAILRLDVDLLWNGGIGTYVKASDETHAAVGDAINDTVRVDATEIRARVVAEGGNLGFTQRARIEYALGGGRINTDAIDNSAGVDMSDHEVNLKIALAGAVEAGELSPGERNQLLTELTAEVTARVLAHNRRQARIMSLDQQRSQTHLNDYRDLMAQLEAAGLLDRHLEALPDRDALRARRSVFLGLTRPELAELLAHTKLALQQALLASTVPDDDFFEQYLRGYFPEMINIRFGHGVRSHRLRREIIAVELANALVDTMGMTFAARVGRDTGAEVAAVARAWAVVVAVSECGKLWAEIADADPPLPRAAEARGWAALEAAVERAVKWIVETQLADVPAGELIETLRAPTDQLYEMLPDVLPASAQEKDGAVIEALAADGMPRALAQRLVRLDRLAEMFEIAHIAGDLDVRLPVAAEAYHRVGDVIDLHWVGQKLTQLPAEDRWERRAIEGLTEGLVYARRQLTRNLLGCRGEGTLLVKDCLRVYLEEHAEQLARVRAIIDDIKSASRPTLAALLVVMRELGRLVDRGAHAPEA